MKTCLFLLLAIGVTSAAPGIRRTSGPRPTPVAGFAASPAFVQSFQIDSGSTANATKSFTNAVGSAHLLIVFVRQGTGAGLCTVTNLNTGGSGGASDTWTEAVNRGSGDGHTNRIFWAKNSGGGTCKIGVTLGASQTLRWMAAEYSGMNTTTQPDQATGNNGTGTALDSGNVSTTVANELIVGFSTLENTGNFTQGASFTQRESLGTKCYFEDRIVTSTGTYNAPVTIDVSGPWVQTMTTFQ